MSSLWGPEEAEFKRNLLFLFENFDKGCSKERDELSGGACKILELLDGENQKLFKEYMLACEARAERQLKNFLDFVLNYFISIEKFEDYKKVLGGNPLAFTKFVEKVGAEKDIIKFD